MKNIMKTTMTCVMALLFGASLVLADPQHSTSKGPLNDLVAIQKALAGDSMEHVKHHAMAISKAVKEHKLHGIATETSQQATKVAQSKSLKSARNAFKELSQSFVDYFANHPDKSGKYRVAYCPMAKASWVQQGEAIRNPYFGKSMLNCGSLKK